jgi:hypothetical protein
LLTAHCSLIIALSRSRVSRVSRGLCVFGVCVFLDMLRSFNTQPFSQSPRNGRLCDDCCIPHCSLLIAHCPLLIAHSPNTPSLIIALSRSRVSRASRGLCVFGVCVFLDMLRSFNTQPILAESPKRETLRRLLHSSFLIPHSSFLIPHCSLPTAHSPNTPFNLVYPLLLRGTFAPLFKSARYVSFSRGSIFVSCWRLMM